MTSKQCPFCEIVRGEDSKVFEVWRDENVVVFFPDSPAALGHCLVVPVRHSALITGLSQEEVSQTFKVAQRVADSLQSTLEPDGINIIQSNGRAATQSVDHVHVHVVPRWEGDAMGDFWPESPEISDRKKEQARRSLAKVISESDIKSAPEYSEAQLYHLSFIQGVIGRMSTASAQVKAWMLPVVTAIYGYAFDNSNAWVVAAGIVAMLIFAYLDLRYMLTERAYRDLYNAASREGSRIKPFSMDTKAVTEGAGFWQRLKPCLASWAFLPVYVAMTIAGVVILCFVWGRL